MTCGNFASGFIIFSSLSAVLKNLENSSDNISGVCVYYSVRVGLV